MTTTKKVIRFLGQENEPPQDDPRSATMLCVAGEATSPTTLAESAALQQAKHSHVELKEVEVVTGEEDESNVFQVTSLLTQHS